MEAALCYLLLWLSGIILYLVEKDKKSIRIHAMQSILIFLPLNILMIIVAAPQWFFYHPWITPPLAGISWFLRVVLVVLWVLFVFNAYQGQKIKIPIISDIAKKNI
jgi:uncharacterized membrane protein